MKKLLTLALAVLIVLSCTVGAMAAPVTGDSGSTVVTYTESTSYTVTIPETITISKTASNQTVSASDVIIPTGKALNVAVSSANYADSSWYVVNTSDNTEKLSYTIKKGDTAVANNDTVLTVAAGDTNGDSASLTLQLTGTATKADTYEDTLTFTVSVDNADGSTVTPSNPGASTDEDYDAYGADEMVISTAGGTYGSLGTKYNKENVYAATLNSGWQGGISAKHTVIDTLGGVITGSGYTYWVDVRNYWATEGYQYVAITFALDADARVQINSLIPNASNSKAEVPVSAGMLLTEGSAPGYNPKCTEDHQKAYFKLYANGAEVQPTDTITAGTWYTVVVKLMQGSEIAQYTAQNAASQYSNVCFVNGNGKNVYISEVRYYKNNTFTADFGA